MRLFIRTLMFLGCLLYGAMPAQSAMTMPMASEHDNHSMPMAHEAGGFAANNGYPCPHRGDMKHAPFCAACIVVLPELVFLDAGKTLFSYPKPGLGAALLTGSPAPPLRPPRA
jgi:hypothetical protein